MRLLAASIFAAALGLGASNATTYVYYEHQDILGQGVASALAASELVVTGRFKELASVPSALTVEKVWRTRACDVSEAILIDFPTALMESDTTGLSGYQLEKHRIEDAMAQIERALLPHMTIELVTKHGVTFKQFVPNEDLTEDQWATVATAASQRLRLVDELASLDETLDESLRSNVIRENHSYLLFLEKSYLVDGAFWIVPHGVQQADDGDLNRKMIGVEERSKSADCEMD